MCLIYLRRAQIVLLIFILYVAENSKHTSEAKIVRGLLSTLENWKFVARFCFMNSHGTFEYDVRYDEAYGVQNIDLYYDTPEQWQSAYGRNAKLTSCREKESVLQVLHITQNPLMVTLVD